MSRNIQPTIHLEVTVPRIVLPRTLSTQSSDNTDATAEEKQASLLPESTRHEDMEKNTQVRLFSTAAESSHASPRNHRPQQGQELEMVSTHTTRQVPFLLFRIAHIIAQGQTYLLQVSRQVHRQIYKQSRDTTYQVTDELAFTLELRQSTAPDAPGTTQEALMRKGNQVVIMLNEEGTPNSYSIDGAER